MKVVRIDLYDFKVTLTEDEFKDITDVCEYDNISLTEVLCSVIEKGFDVLNNGQELKE